jgi:hypothetical protein
MLWLYNTSIFTFVGIRCTQVSNEREQQFLYLTRIGWKTGGEHRIEIWFVPSAAKYYSKKIVTDVCKALGIWDTIGKKWSLLILLHLSTNDNMHFSFIYCTNLLEFYSLFICCNNSKKDWYSYIGGIIALWSIYTT